MVWDKTVSQKEGVKAFLVEVDGKVDLNASLEKFRAACVKHIAAKETDNERIAQCIDKVFDDHLGASLNMDYVTSSVFTQLRSQIPELKDPAMYGMVSSRISDVLHENTGEGKKYAKKMGKGGGFYRQSDRQPEAK